MTKRVILSFFAMLLMSSVYGEGELNRFVDFEKNAAELKFVENDATKDDTRAKSLDVINIDDQVSACMEALDIPQGCKTFEHFRWELPTRIQGSDGDIYRLVPNEEDGFSILSANGEVMTSCYLCKFDSEYEARRYPIKIGRMNNSMPWKSYSRRRREIGNANQKFFSFESGVLIFSKNTDVFVSYRNVVLSLNDAEGISAGMLRILIQSGCVR